MTDNRTALRLSGEDLLQWRWIVREFELQNQILHRINDQKNTLLMLINERYGLTDGDQFMADGQIRRRPAAAAPSNVTPISGAEEAVK